ncbi:MAG: hypothetical protein LBP54_07445, partial [Campylobacteraceae bacterium]|nr:hypothetical protein [Campylobacteraceae bacterium]
MDWFSKVTANNMFVSKFQHFFRLFSLLFALNCLFASNLSAACTATEDNGVVCDSTVNSAVYNHATLDIPSRDYLNVTISGGAINHGIHNDNNGTWNIAKVNVNASGYGVFANDNYYSGTVVINIGSGSTISGRMGVYGSGSNINIGDNTNIFAVMSGQGYGVYGSYSNITIGDNVNIFIMKPDSYPGYGVYGSGSNINIGDNVSIISDDGRDYGVYGYYSNITIGDNLNIRLTGNGSVGVHGYSAPNIHIGDNAAILVNGTAVLAENSNVSNDYGTLNIAGNIISAWNGYVNLTFADNSLFSGSTAKNYNIYNNNGIIDLSFYGANSLWELTGDSNLTNLYLANNARVDLTRGGASLTAISPTVLTTDNLYGNGIFDIRVDITNDLNDKIVILESSSGSHQIRFFDQATGGYDAGDTALLVVNQYNPLGDYQAAYSGTIDIGGYTYTLKKASTNDNWYIMPSNAAITPNCAIVGGGVICYNTVNKEIYADTTLDISNRDYLSINTYNTHAAALINDRNGTWNINRLNINTDMYAVAAKGSEIVIGDNSVINTADDFGQIHTAVYAQNSNISFGKNSYINGTVVLLDGGNISMGENTVINAIMNTTVDHSGSAISSTGSNMAINIADNSHINGYIEITGNNSLFYLGDNSSIGVVYVEHDNDTESWQEWAEYVFMADDAENLSIIIGNGTEVAGSIHIGRNSNLTIGDNAQIKSY